MFLWLHYSFPWFWINPIRVPCWWIYTPWNVFIVYNLIFKNYSKCLAQVSVAFTLTSHKEGLEKLLSSRWSNQIPSIQCWHLWCPWGHGLRRSDMLSSSSKMTKYIDCHRPFHSSSLRKKMGWKKGILNVHFSFFYAIFTHFHSSTASFSNSAQFFWSGKTLCHFIRLNIVKWIPRWGNVSHYDSEQVIAMCTVGGCNIV